jgi:site-specific DNA recombinase
MKGTRPSTDGITDLDEVLREGLADITPDRDRAWSALDRIKSQGPMTPIDQAKIERFGSLMRESITAGAFRSARPACAHWSMLVDDRVIRIHRSRTTFQQAVVASCHLGKRVRDLVRQWRATQNKTANLYVEISL